MPRVLLLLLRGCCPAAHSPYIQKNQMSEITRRSQNTKIRPTIVTSVDEQHFLLKVYNIFSSILVWIVYVLYITQTVFESRNNI
jgi:hypothetical protein